MRLNRYFAYASAACGLVVLLLAILACGGGGDFSADGGGCPQPALGSHAVPANGFGCHIECAPGFFDCDGDHVDGCESTVQCSVLGDAVAPPPPIHLMTLLSGMPHGISACGGNVFYFDDSTLTTVDGKKIFTLLGTPASGIACDGANLYFAMLSNGDAGPNGAVYRFHLGDSAPTQVAAGVDPGRGVDTRGDDVYWIARPGMLEVTNDAGTTPLVPATETTTYKSFALLDDATYAISGGSVWASPLDGGAPFALAFDATNARALLRANAPLPIAIMTLDAGDSIVIADDASTPITSIAHVVASASDGTHAVFATDDAVYEWTYNAGVKSLSSPYLHITDITLDATHAYWSTRGAGATPGAIWKASL